MSYEASRSARRVNWTREPGETEAQGDGPKPRRGVEAPKRTFGAVRRRHLTPNPSLVDSLNVFQLPRLVEVGLFRTVEPEIGKPACAWDGFDPVRCVLGFFGSEIYADRSIAASLLT